MLASWEIKLTWMACSWKLHAEADDSCMVARRAPPPVHMRGFRRPSTGILYSGHQVSTKDTMITGSDRHSACLWKNSISDRPSGWILLSLGDEESLHFSLRLSHPGSKIYFSSCTTQGFFINTYWDYVRGSFRSHTGHCSHSHPTSWQLLLAGRPGFCIQNPATAVWFGSEPVSKAGQWH